MGFRFRPTPPHADERRMSGPSSLKPPTTSSPGIVWSPAARWLASLALAWHFVGVLVGPISTPPSALGAFLQRFYRPYLQAVYLYLDHGYKFFGPDPGPSHLVRYELVFPNGRRQEGVLPAIGEHWPRLLYHRYFMLSEFIHGLSGEWDPRFDEAHQPLSPPQRAYARSYADHLLAKYGAQRVTLYLIEHNIPLPEHVLRGVNLDDPQFYASRKLGTFERAGR